MDLKITYFLQCSFLQEALSKNIQPDEQCQQERERVGKCQYEEKEEEDNEEDERERDSGKNKKKNIDIR